MPPDPTRPDPEPFAGPHDLALVLGGGGAAGNAWEIGFIAGLAAADTPIDLVERADLVIGTSAGATATAQVRSGATAAELYAAIVDAAPGAPGPPRAPGRGFRPDSAIPTPTVFDRMRAIGAAATDAADLQRAMGAFALECDAILGEPAADAWRATAASRLPGVTWSDRPTVITTLDAHTGALALFDQRSGVDIAAAVAASTALPGLVPTQPIGDGRYMDGGVRASENADLAAGYTAVLVLAPLAGRNPADTPPGQFEGLRRFPEVTLDTHVAQLRAQGSRVEVVLPDPASRAAMGVNATDPRVRVPTARAGFDQGRAAAATLEGFTNR
jgi:NTE family protein